MKFIRCSGCGANVKFDKETGVGVCEYCNTTYYARDFFESDSDPISTPGTHSYQSYKREVRYSKLCNSCSREIQLDDSICPYCGEEQMTFKNNNSYYNFSGTNFNETNSEGTAKNKSIALLLCIFLGMYGAHKFYEGKIVMGLLYLFTGGLFGIGWIVDILILLRKPSIYYV